MSDEKLLADIDGLIKQATTERSHYYTASVLLRAKAEIERLRHEIRAAESDRVTASRYSAEDE